MKRGLSFILSLLMILSMLPVSVLAQQNQGESGLVTDEDLMVKEIEFGKWYNGDITGYTVHEYEIYVSDYCIVQINTNDIALV